MTSPANDGDAYAEAAGDPGEAAEMPVLTGNSPGAGQADVEFDEAAAIAAESLAGADSGSEVETATPTPEGAQK
ncbi:hypothetical protein [Yinghuangia soli]|uniref:Uncharacterized protein n=1 Tax=Yinghuangia soli TaxID=2908204 RepID=A0AA41PVU4_9ACTN|nr:hypothetical protein [Yinghuangia soli]MCF2525834.1 hypothetical protein [Yinghuangia soli]